MQTIEFKKPFLPVLKGALLMMSIICISAASQAQSSQQAFTLQQVKLLPGIFKDAQQTDMNYMLSLDPDRLLAPYLKEAGLPAKKDNYPNWENTGLDGHIGGHYLSALSNMVAATDDKRMNERLDYMLGELKRCQDKIGTGYLGGMPGGIALWNDIAAGKITSDTFALNTKWVPLYNLHKTLGGLHDAYLITGKPVAKDMLIRLVDFIDSISNKLTDAQIQTMLFSEHGSMNEVFADVYAITGNNKYLTLARRYSHRMILDPLILGEDKLTGLHANMQIPKVVGFERIAELSGDTNYAKASRFFWETVVANRSVVIGGNSVNEHFNPSNDFTSMLMQVAGPETCNTYNMLKLTKEIFLTDGQLRYIDYYERALYNHILSSQHPETGGFVYYTSMRPRHYRVYSRPQDCMWCCVGSGMENHGKYGELIYSHINDDVYVNLFMASQLNWQEKGLVLSQQTSFPDKETTTLVVESVKQGSFSINIRYPGWVDAGKLEVKVNGTKVPIEVQLGSYVKLNRTWKKGDKIEVYLPMKLTTEKLPDNSSYVAFLHGPIVLAAKTDMMDADSCLGNGANQFGGYRPNGKTFPLEDVPAIEGNQANLTNYLKPVNGKAQTFTMSGIIYPADSKNLELVPFYKIHDARYMIYWPVPTKGE